MNKLDGKVAIVTGAGAGIARVTAKLFADEGATVVIAEIKEDLGRTVQEEITSAGGRALCIQTDVTDAASVRQTVEATIGNFGGLNILFNCAGGSFSEDGPVGDVDLDQWKKTMDFNLFSAFLCSKYALQHMVSTQSGAIINTATWGAIRGAFPKHIYTTAKAGVIALTRSIAGYYTKSGIRANVIVPGSVRTEQWKANSVHPKDPFPEEMRRQYRENYPFSIGDPIDIANIALFLASDDSRLITGATIHADGGRSAF